MKVAVIHPYKHHAYYSLGGVKRAGVDVYGFFGYYNRNDVIDKILQKSKFSKLVEGYKYAEIDDIACCNFFIKILYLLARKCPNKFNDIYIRNFEKWTMRLIKNKKIDCIHVLQDYCNNVIRYAKENDIKIIYEQIIAYDIDQFIPGSSNENKKEKLSMERENMDYATKIIYASDFVATSIINHYSNEELVKKFVKIPYGASLKEFKYIEHEFKNDRKLRMLCVASISRRKGIDVLFNAMERMKDVPVQLTLIGIPEGDIGEKILQRVNDSNINYVGSVPHNLISEYYQNADIYILPSLAEGSSLSVYEALSCGLPCIVTYNTGSVICDGEDGFVIEAGNGDQIVNCVKSIINEPQLVEKMSLQTKMTIQKYSWDTFEKKIAKVYIELNGELL